MKKILVVEDEYYARKSIVKILQESDLVQIMLKRNASSATAELLFHF